MIELIIYLKTVSTSISFCFVKAIVILIHNYSNYNLGQNKMEQHPPPPPQITDDARLKPKRAIFLSLIWGGGTNFLSILSNIVERLVLRNLTCTVSPFSK